MNVKLLFKRFFQSISSAVDLRRPVYMAVVAQSFDLRQILITMTKINWEVKDVMSQHNTYIDVILRVNNFFFSRHILSDLIVSLSGNTNFYSALGTDQSKDSRNCRRIERSLGEYRAHYHSHVGTRVSCRGWEEVECPNCFF